MSAIYEVDDGSKVRTERLSEEEFNSLINQSSGWEKWWE